MIKIRRLLTHRATIHNKPQKARSTTWDLIRPLVAFLSPGTFYQSSMHQRGDPKAPTLPHIKNQTPCLSWTGNDMSRFIDGIHPCVDWQRPLSRFLRTPSGKMTMSADVKSWYISDIHCKRGGAILELSKNLRIHQPFWDFFNNPNFKHHSVRFKTCEGTILLKTFPLAALFEVTPASCNIPPTCREVPWELHWKKPEPLGLKSISTRGCQHCPKPF